KFHTFNIINSNGDIDPDGWASMKNALLCPHHEAVCNQAHSESCREEKEMKRHCYEDSHPEQFGITSFTGTHPAKKKHMRKEQTSPEASKSPEEGEEEDLTMGEFTEDPTL
ncbi:hypothetical protein C0993_003654, partial [Termitomyces sp. T159_Od127]